MQKRTIPEPLRSRAAGCLLGQLTGDALGSQVEFMPPEAIEDAFPGGVRTIGPSPIWQTIAGQPTDDSELALALARSLVRCGAYDEEDVAGAYTDWLESAPFDVGGTVGRATRGMAEARRRGAPLASTGRAVANPDSQANGALMRQSPLAIWGHRLPDWQLALWVDLDTTMTHPNQVCKDASKAYLVALAAVIREGLDPEGAYAVARAWDQKNGRSREVTHALEAARSEPPAFVTSSGRVLVALQNAFYQALHAPTCEEAMVRTVGSGGDTDTNGAICGALVGALYGLDALPGQWRRVVLYCKPGGGGRLRGILQPRPRVYWPVDALSLADQLVAS
jgi:ADP-ribosyl-[dinitrogen reductase] hydrolase